MQKIKIIIIALFLATILVGQENEKIIEKWDNGVVRTKHYYKGTGFDEELVGVKKYYKNGDLRIKARYSNNKLHGEYFYYLEGNNLLVKGNFKDGDYSNGNWYCYYPEAINIDNLNNSSPNLFWKIEVPYTSAIYSISAMFHDNGELANYNVMRYQDSNSEGKNSDNSFQWYNNGILERLDKYNGFTGRTLGWTIRWKNGKIKNTTKYLNDKDFESKSYRENGVIESSIDYLNNKYFLSRYDQYGKLKDTATR